MRYLSILVILIISGCSHAWVYKDDMQPDGTYKIETGGNLYASSETVMNSAFAQAESLCPNGYEKKTAFCNGSAKAYCTLIVRCK